jgi:hypothetical protein
VAAQSSRGILKVMKIYKKTSLIIISIVSALACSTPVFSANFAPNLLKITAPETIIYCYYQYSELKVPVTISGTPATVYLLIYLKDSSEYIKNVRSGYLGWRYVNNIDTCVYVSPPYHFDIGKNTITWSQKDAGTIFDFTYGASFYLWGYDDRNPKTPAARHLNFHYGDRSTILTKGTDMNPLPQPIIYDAPQSFSNSPEQTLKTRTKWVIGDDIDYPLLKETCSYMSWAENSRIFMDNFVPGLFYTQTLKPDGNIVLRSYQWVPNGQAQLNKEWGINGEFFFKTNLKAGHSYNDGPVGDGADLLFITDGDPYGGKQSDLLFVNRMSGDFIKKVDTDKWFTSDDGNLYGPSTVTFSNGLVFCGSLGSCITMAIDPYRPDNDEISWVNGNGDFIGDKNYDPSSPNPWKCNDPVVPPYPATLSCDVNRFSVFPADGMGSVSFGVFTPDGKGLGYFPIAGDTGTVHKGIHIVNYGSAYDGIYCDNSSAGADSSGWWYVGYDCFRGRIWDGSEHYMYSDWPIKLHSFNDGGVYHSGDVKTIIWIPMMHQVTKVEFSSDNGKTWSILADSAPPEEIGFDWTIPDVSSDQCLIRITNLNKPENISISDQPFTIERKSGISESGDFQSGNSISASCYPNPFNPYTTLRYTLSRNGKVTITLFNALGQKIRQFDRGEESKGTHEMRLDGRNLSTGMYFFRIESGSAFALGKMIVVK